MEGFHKSMLQRQDVRLRFRERLSLRRGHEFPVSASSLQLVSFKLQASSFKSEVWSAKSSARGSRLNLKLHLSVWLGLSLSLGQHQHQSQSESRPQLWPRMTARAGSGVSKEGSIIFLKRLRDNNFHTVGGFFNNLKSIVHQNGFIASTRWVQMSFMHPFSCYPFTARGFVRNWKSGCKFFKNT